MKAFIKTFSVTVGALFALLMGCGGLLDPDEPGNLVPKTVTEDPTLPKIYIHREGNTLANGTNYPGTYLHAEAFGNSRNPMVMVLHGGPGADYRALLPLKSLVADGYYVVFWDQRGGGLSQRHDADIYSFDLYLEDLRRVIEYYSQDAPNGPIGFIGHSWGGMYATWFINEYGDYGGRIQAAIVSEAGAFTSSQLKDYMEEHLGSIELFSEQRNDVAWLGQILTADDHASLDYKQMLWAAGGTPSEHIDPDNPSPLWRAGAVVKNSLEKMALEDGFDWTTNLSRFSHKVLFLRGELNETMTLQHQTHLASFYPDAYVVTIPDVGHEMIWERPEEYLAHTRAYFQDIGFSGGRQ